MQTVHGLHFASKHSETQEGQKKLSHITEKKYMSVLLLEWKVSVEGYISETLTSNAQEDILQTKSVLIVQKSMQQMYPANRQYVRAVSKYH